MFTDKNTYSRRKAIAMGLGLTTTASGAQAGIFSDLLFGKPVKPDVPLVAPTLTTKLGATTYNNAYEFGNSKTDPSQHGDRLNREGWTVEIEGTHNDGVYDIDELMGMPFNKLEQRTYRMRCVERWSMVIPWDGRPMKDIISVLDPLGSAKYVNFECDTSGKGDLPGTSSRFSTIDWPYKESIRMDEAMNPLTFATFGAFGDQDLPQNGMPLKINIPWKYGYKSPKFVTKISFSDNPGVATWNQLAPNEYGYYSNVNPTLRHPRWSQKDERRIWSQNHIDNISTEQFNGYGEEVAHMYPDWETNGRKYF